MPVVVVWLADRRSSILARYSIIIPSPGLAPRKVHSDGYPRTRIHTHIYTNKHAPDLQYSAHPWFGFFVRRIEASTARDGECMFWPQMLWVWRPHGLRFPGWAVVSLPKSTVHPSSNARMWVTPQWNGSSFQTLAPLDDTPSAASTFFNNRFSFFFWVIHLFQ